MEYFQLILIYIGNGAICGTETSNFLDVLYLEHILDTVGRFKPVQANYESEPGRKPKNMTFCLLQNTRNFQHICMRSPILVVTLHAALENDSTVHAG